MWQIHSFYELRRRTSAAAGQSNERSVSARPGVKTRHRSRKAQSLNARDTETVAAVPGVGLRQRWSQKHFGSVPGARNRPFVHPLNAVRSLERRTASSEIWRWRLHGPFLPLPHSLCSRLPGGFEAAKSTISASGCFAPSDNAVRNKSSRPTQGVLPKGPLLSLITTQENQHGTMVYLRIYYNPLSDYSMM